MAGHEGTVSRRTANKKLTKLYCSRFEHTHYSSTLAPRDGWSGALLMLVFANDYDFVV